MNFVDVPALIARLAETTNMSPPDIERISIAFLNIAGDISDLESAPSALKVIVPLLLAYTDIDNIYGNDVQKSIVAAITENSRIKITVNVPISDLLLIPEPSGVLIAS
jgi:hypothetical protein